MYKSTQIKDNAVLGSDSLLKGEKHGFIWHKRCRTNLQKIVAKEMTTWGFERGKYNPCLF